MELIKAFLEDVEAIMEPDSRLKFWEKEMRDIAHEAKAIIGTYENTRDASILKNMEAENKVVQEISMIKKKIQEITERRIAYGIEHVEASNSMTQRRYQRRPSSQYSEESVVIGFEDHVFEIKERLLTLNKPGCCVILIVGMAGSGKTTLAESIYNDNAVHFIPMLGFLYFLKSILLKIFCKTYGKK
ncbi:disease resistance protein rpp13 [Fagus crenata]